MATVTKPIALDESLNTTEQTPRNVADVLAQELARIAGRQASDVDYDNTDSGLTADNVQGAIDELRSDIPTVNDGTLTIQQNGETKGTFTANQSGNSTVNIEIPTTDIQTAVDEFSTYNGGILDSLKVALSSIQDLHGYAEPWVGGSKKNKLPLVLADIKTDNTAGTWSGNKYTNNGVEWEIVTDEDGNVTEIVANNLATGNSVLYVKRKPQLEENTNYILNGCPANGSNSTYRMAYSNQVNQDYSDTGNGVTFQKFDYVTYPNSAVFCVVYNGYTANNIKFKPMARLATESDPTFEPYSNICPISGHTQVEVEVSNPNLIEEMQDGVWLATNGTYSVIAGYCCSKKFRIAPNKTYNVFATADATIGTDNAVLFYDENDNYLGQNTGGIIRSTTVPFTFTAPSNAYYCALDLKVRLSDLLTAEIVADKEQITVNLGGTYYSGTLDVVSGVLTVTHAKYVLREANIQSGTVLGSYVRLYFTPSDTPVESEGLYSHGIYKANYTEQSSHYYASSTNLIVFVIGETAQDAKDYIEAQYAGGKPLEIVYPISTPFTIQLSPTMVKALVGENHLSAPLDGQEITESKYKQAFTFDDVIAYIQSLS